MPAQPIAALYLRSASQNDAAIAEQRRLCVHHAETQGWSVREIFEDNGASGMRQGPGLAALRSCLTEGRAQIVLATAPVRIARDPEIIADLVSFCEMRGAEIAFVNGAPTTLFKRFELPLERQEWFHEDTREEAKP